MVLTVHGNDSFIKMTGENLKKTGVVVLISVDCLVQNFVLSFWTQVLLLVMIAIGM